MDRRTFLQASVAGGIGLALGPVAALSVERRAALPVCIFSKHLQWADNYDHMAALAAEIGFDGVDLTVRPGGHVLPEKADDDLPRAAEAVRKAGLAMPMIVTNLTEASETAEKVFKTAAGLGVKFYRTGNFYYQPQPDLPAQIKRFNAALRGLAALGGRHGLTGCVQNHASAPPSYYAGAAIWDFKELLDGTDPRWMGVQYDPHHATAEGGDNWPLNLRLIAPLVRTLNFKDFYWTRRDGKRFKQNCALGEGTVDFPEFLRQAKAFGFNGPVSMHFEQPLGGAEHGDRKLTMDKKELTAAMKKDLQTLRRWLTEAGF